MIKRYLEEIMLKCKQYWNEWHISESEMHAALEFIHTRAVHINDDIKDSIIVWHDLRKDPEDLPPLQRYVFVSDGENSHVAALLPEGWNFLGNVPTFKIIEWAYIPKSPKE